MGLDKDGSGEVSELSMATPQGGADGVPGTDDGVPPAEEAGHVPAGGPRDYENGGVRTNDALEGSE